MRERRSFWAFEVIFEMEKGRGSESEIEIRKESEGKQKGENSQVTLRGRDYTRERFLQLNYFSRFLQVEKRS